MSHLARDERESILREKRQIGYTLTNRQHSLKIILIVNNPLGYVVTFNFYGFFFKNKETPTEIQH